VSAFIGEGGMQGWWVMKILAVMTPKDDWDLEF